MNILLINPPFQRLSKVCNPYFPLGLGYVAAVLDAEGFFVRIYNTDKGVEVNDFPMPHYNEARINAHDNFVMTIKDRGHYVWKKLKHLKSSSRT